MSQDNKTPEERQQELFGEVYKEDVEPPKSPAEIAAAFEQIPDEVLMKMQEVREAEQAEQYEVEDAPDEPYWFRW